MTKEFQICVVKRRELEIKEEIKVDSKGYYMIGAYKINNNNNNDEK